MDLQAKAKGSDDDDAASVHSVRKLFDVKVTKQIQRMEQLETAQTEKPNVQPVAAVAVAPPAQKKQKCARTHHPHHDNVYRHFKKFGLDKSKNTMVLRIYCDEENEEMKSRYQWRCSKHVIRMTRYYTTTN
jgi:hypothetical protein